MKGNKTGRLGEVWQVVLSGEAAWEGRRTRTSKAKGKYKAVSTLRSSMRGNRIPKRRSTKDGGVSATTGAEYDGAMRAAGGRERTKTKSNIDWQKPRRIAAVMPTRSARSLTHALQTAGRPSAVEVAYRHVRAVVTQRDRQPPPRIAP